MNESIICQKSFVEISVRFFVVWTEFGNLRTKDESMEHSFYDKELRQIKDLLAEAAALCENPSPRLNAGEISLAHHYLTLGKSILEAGLPEQPHLSRAEGICDRFLQLLADNHPRERSVRFYADKLCLSPKYFSKLIKDASGRGASEWIDIYVLNAAKDYLKHSDLSIKQIVFALHFPDQPSFTKYFKSHTGLTPAQFRKS